MKLPGIEECEKLLKEFEVSKQELDSVKSTKFNPATIRRGEPNALVRAHTDKVRALAVFLAEKIFSQGHSISMDLVDQAALLHDLVKLHCIKANCGHAREASRIIEKRGYPELAKVVGLHGLEAVNHFDENTPIEAKVVWYADKRVNNDKLVSMEERYVFLKERYGSLSDKKMNEILSTEGNAKKLEAEIFDLAGLKKDVRGSDLFG